MSNGLPSPHNYIIEGIGFLCFLFGCYLIFTDLSKKEQRQLAHIAKVQKEKGEEKK